MTIPNISETVFDEDRNDTISCNLDAQGVPCDACLGLKQAEQQILPSFSFSTFNLDEKIRTLKARVNYRHDALHRIPLETASQIFSSFLDDVTASGDTFACGATARATWSAPLLLASVCHTWRMIALSAPQLWTSIHVHLTTISTIPGRIELSKQWLRRTGQLPLSISLSFADTYPTHTVAPLFDLMRDCSSRWRHLTLRIAAIYYNKLVCRRDTLPALEAILLHPPPASVWAVEDTFGVGPTPALRHLAVSNLSLARLPVPWARLTSFEAADVFLADIMHLLRAAPALERVRLARISGSTGVFPLPTAPLVHGALRELALHPDGDVAVKLELLLARLVLPALARLECDFAGSRDCLPAEALCALFARSQCVLTHFVVRVTEPYTRMSEAALMAILRGVPTLTHLAVFTGSRCAVPILSDTLLGRLAGPVSDSGFLPRLETLEYAGRRTFSWAAVVQLFPSTESQDDTTHSSNKPLNEVQIKLSRRPSDPLQLMPKDIREQLLHARKSGICVDVTDSDGTDIISG